ncbi:MAG: MBL fold metallo-hydrolase [Myxococcales bacterium]|nr:MBL fold metallo-hydrolase [Myxococcales bacterium]
MKRGRRWLLRASLALLVVALVVAAPFVTAFRGLAPIVDGAELAPGVRTVKMSFVSAFVLDAGEGRAVLVDAGADRAGTALLAALRAAGSAPDAVLAVLLTHGHGDHLAAAPLFRNAAIVALEAERRLVEGTVTSRSPMGRWSRAKPTGVRVTRAVRDGESLRFGSLDVRVFALPGHTVGSAAYLARGVLFVGDAASATEDRHVRGPAWVFSESVDRGAASLRALGARLRREGLPVTALAPAHSGPLTGDVVGALSAIGQ